MYGNDLENARFEQLRRRILPSIYDSPEPKNPSVSFHTDLIDHDDIERISRFFNKVDTLDKEKLLSIFQTVDKMNKVDCIEPANAAVVEIVETFVGRILVKIGELDTRFKSTFIRCGSFYDGVKIGKPDEFDFTAKIESLCDLEGLEARFSSTKKGFVYLVVKDATAISTTFSDFIVQAEEDDILLKGENILCVSEILSHFRILVDRALKRIHIPKELSPSNTNWHSICNGPCATICASYASRSQGEMELDIDIAPTFDLPDHEYCPPVLNPQHLLGEKNPFQTKLKEILQNETKVRLVVFTFDTMCRDDNGEAWSYKYSNTCTVSFNALEKVIFSLYDTDSVEKQLYRVLKLIKETHIQSSDGLVTKAGTTLMKQEEPPSTTLTSVTVEPVGLQSEHGASGFSVEPISGYLQEDLWEDVSDDITTESGCSDEETCIQVIATGADGHAFKGVSNTGIEIVYDRKLSVSHSQKNEL